MLFPTDDLAGRRSAHRGAETEPFTRLMRHVLTYKSWLAGAAVLGLALSGLALCFVTPTYEAQAVVIVDSRRNKLADAESALSSIVVDQYQSALKSELELILSPEIARYVIKSLGLLGTREYKSALTHVSTASRFAALGSELSRGTRAALATVGLRSADTKNAKDQNTAQPPAALAPDPGGVSEQDAVMQNAVKIFRQTFWADNDPKSLTIRVGYRSTSPVLAAAVTNAVVQRYLAADEEVKAAAVDRSQAWLKGRIAQLRADLDAAEHAVEDFRASHELATIRDRSPLQQQLLQLESRQVDARAELSAAQAKVAQNRQGGGPDALAAGADVLASRLIQGLREQEATLAAEQAQLSSTLLPSHPSMIKIAGQLAKLRSAIRGEVERIAQSNTSNVKLAETRLADVSEQIQAVQEKIDAANSADIRLRSLEADAAAKRKVLDTFTQRYDQNAGAPFTPPDSRVVSWASVPTDASSPRYGLVLAGSMLGFVFLAFGLSLSVERLRRGFANMSELEDELGLVVAGITPALSRRAMNGRKSSAAADSPPTREMALTVRAFSHTPGARPASRVVLVTSAVAGEGKSTAALSLARSVAKGGQRCLLIDADIRDPSMHASLRVPASPGLVELTSDGFPIEAVIRRVPGEQFDFMSAGRPAPDALSPFTIDAFRSVLANLKRGYDVIVLDSAPVLLASETLVLIGCADLTLFLVKWRTTPREVARKAALLLARCSTKPCLAVLSQVNLRRMRGAGGNYMEEQYRKAYGFL